MKKEVVKRRNAVYAVFFMVAAVLFIASIPEQKWFSAIIAVPAMFLSLIMYGKKRIEMKEGIKGKKEVEETNTLFGMYLIVWLAGLTLAVLSIFRENYLPALMGLFAMFFCSLIAGLAHKKIDSEE